MTIDELDIDGFARMAVMYSVLELSTAVKPWLLRWMLRDGADGAVYLDPDMRVYAPLTEMFDAVREHGLVLNPHNTDPMPRDGRKPNEQDILIAGAYNLGFIGIGSGEFADTLLDWWGVRLERDCIVDPERGFFVDQRWIDLVPGMAEDFYVLRDPGFNVAYWNLPTRTVERARRAPGTSSDVPLSCSTSAASTPPSRTCSPSTRTASGWPTSRRWRSCARPTRRSWSRTASDEVSDWPYTYDASASGIPLDQLNRRVYRDLMANGFDESLFEQGGEAAFAEAASAPAEIGGEFGVTRYLSTLHDAARRPQAALPRPRQPRLRARLRRVGAHDRAPRGADPGGAAAAAPRARRPQRGLRGRAHPAAGLVRPRGRAGRQRRRLPQLRARRRRGRAPGHRRARRRRGRRRFPSG